MKPNIIRLLIILNTFIFIVSLGIIYQRGSQIFSRHIQTDTGNAASNLEKKEKVENKIFEGEVLQQQEIEKQTQNLQPPQKLENLSSQPTLTKPPAEQISSSEEKSVKLRKPKFVYFSSKAKKVSLIGDFNGWIPQPMKKVDNKRWELVLEIPEGKYHYNFLVDGKPILDPNNKKPPEISKQGFKSSILELK